MTVMRLSARMPALAAAATAAIISAAGVSAAASPHLTSGQRVAFRTGVLKIGSRVSCTSHSIRVVARVPVRGHGLVKIADGAKGGSATIWLTTRTDGSVIARCR
jgi:hypothetical protein